MKISLTVFIAILCLNKGVYGVFGAFHDPIHTAETRLNELARIKRYAVTIDKWRENYRLINKQIDEIQHIGDRIGDAKSAVQSIEWDILKGRRPYQFYEQEYLIENIRRGVTGLESLKYDLDGIFKEVKETDSEGNTIERDIARYKPNEVIEEQFTMMESVNQETAKRRLELIQEKNELVAQMEKASTDTEIQALTAKMDMINGEFEFINHMRQDELNKLQAQEIINRNQREKEKRASLEEFIHNQSKIDQKLSDHLRTIKIRKDY